MNLTNSACSRDYKEAAENNCLFRVQGKILHGPLIGVKGAHCPSSRRNGGHQMLSSTSKISNILGRIFIYFSVLESVQ